jgi:hypothetical protein
MSEKTTADARIYRIVRYYKVGQRHRTRKNIRVGVTLDEAQAHCNNPATSGEGWFDGYEYMPGRGPAGGDK